MEAGAITLGTILDKEMNELLNENDSFTNDDKEDNPIKTARDIFSDKVERMLEDIFKF